MSDLIEAVRKNRETFYNFSTGKPAPVWPAHAIKGAASFAISFFSGSFDAQFLSAILTVFGILIGFTFNVLVYLLSFGKIGGEPGESIEQQVRKGKLEKLGEELFWNVSYFNLVAFSVVVVTLLSFLSFGSVAPTLKAAIALLGRITITWLVAESLHSFIRAANRVTYYFSQKKSIG